MFKIFFAIFFLSEVIIASAIISKILHWRKCVNHFNQDVLFFQRKITPFFIDIRLFLEDIIQGVYNLKNYFIQKRREYTLKVLNSSMVYLVLFLLRGKYKKAVLVCLFGKDVLQGILESI